MNTDKPQEQLPFMEGLFSPSEASGILSNMIGSAINYCSIQQWSEWERNHSADLSHFDTMKKDFSSKRSQIKEQLKELGSDECKVKIELVLNVQVTNN